MTNKELCRNVDIICRSGDCEVLKSCTETLYKNLELYAVGPPLRSGSAELKATLNDFTKV